MCLMSYSIHLSFVRLYIIVSCTCVCPCVRACTFVRACVRACVRARSCVRACVRACVRVSVFSDEKNFRYDDVGIIIENQSQR